MLKYVNEQTREIIEVTRREKDDNEKRKKEKKIRKKNIRKKRSEKVR
jgi:hypothetical protein